MKKNKKGFTLIELLAVIIILGVLLLVAVPGISSLISTSKRRAFESAAKLAVENVEQASAIEKEFSGFVKCYVKLSDINSHLSRGKLDNNNTLNGYILVDTDGKGTIYYSNGIYSISGKTLDQIDSSAEKSSTAVADAPSDATISTCTWYEG